MNITIEALESYLSDRYGGCSIVKSSPVVSTKPLKAKCFQGFFFSRNQTSYLLPHF